MRYNNRFFRTEEEAKAFRKERGGGVLLHLTPRSKKETRFDFYAEMAIAYEARGEDINPEETPWCVAWNELR